MCFLASTLINLHFNKHSTCHYLIKILPKIFKAVMNNFTVVIEMVEKKMITPDFLCICLKEGRKSEYLAQY